MGETEIALTDKFRNLGVIFDNHLSMISHVNKVCKVCSLAFLAIRTIGQIRRNFNRQGGTRFSAEKLVHAFVTSRLDYCNSLLYGLSRKLISKSQRIQNVATRLVLGLKKKTNKQKTNKQTNTIISVGPLTLK